MFTQIVVPGTTPTGVGLVLAAGKLRFTTPCCNTLFFNHGKSTQNPDWSISAWCRNCGTEHTELMFKTGAVLYHDMSKLESVQADLEWLANGLGYDCDEVDFQVTVE